MSERGEGGTRRDPRPGRQGSPKEERGGGHRGLQREERRHGESRRSWGPSEQPSRLREADYRCTLSGRGRGFRGGQRQQRLPEYLERALESTRQRKGQVLCNAWSMHLESDLKAWGYPLSIKESGTGRPVEEKKERRKVVAELLKSLTGTQKPLAGETPRRVVSRGAQHSELLRWIIVYSERIRELILDEQTREVAVREGEAASKVYNVTFGEERQLTGPNWRFYFVAAMMITLEAANFRRALGQSQYIKLDTRTLRTDAQLYGIDATLIQSEKAWLIKVNRHDRKLEPGLLEDRLREMDYQTARIKYRNRLCVAVHKGNIYRIVEVTDTTADRATFEKGGATISVAQYFKDVYNQNVDGKQVVTTKEARGGSRLCYLPANLLRVIAQAPQAIGSCRPIMRPKSAQETLIECTELMNSILRMPAVREQMAELKLRIGDDSGLPVDIQENITSLKRLIENSPSFGEPRISWGAKEKEHQQDTYVDLSPDFRARLCNNLVLRHKVPLSGRWMLVVCTGRREHGSSRAVETINNTIELTRQRIRYKNQLVVDMEAPACCEHFVRSEQDWKKGRVERTKRSLRELFSENRQYLRGAIVLLAYDSDEVNNRVRVAAKQFQTKITDDSNHAGVPWAADQLLAPLSEGIKKVSEVVRVIGIAVNSFGPPNARCGVVGIVGGTNIEHTQFVSHIGASSPHNYRAGVIRDMARHFKLFWEKLNLRFGDGKIRRAPVHLLIYRSSPSGISQIRDVLAHEVGAIRRVVDADLGKIEFSPETCELTVEHAMAAAFPDAEFAVTVSVCSGSAMRRFAGKAEALGQYALPEAQTLSCPRAIPDSEGRYILRFKLPEDMVPLYRPLGFIVGIVTFPEPQKFQFERREDEEGITLPEDHPILVYARANSRWMIKTTLLFSASADGSNEFGASIVSVDGEVAAEVKIVGSGLNPGDIIYLKKATVHQIFQRVFINVLVNPHRPANPIKFFMKGREGVQGLPVGSYIDSGPITPVLPNTETLEEKFLIGTADPTRGSPSASEFHIVQNESDWSKQYLAVLSYKMCHMYYNWAGTVKHPHLLQMALAIVRQHQIYVASESGFGLESEFALEEKLEAKPVADASESPEEGEEQQLRQRVQRRKQEVGYAAVGLHHAHREALEAEERDAGLENLKELKANLENKQSRLMTTAFML
ncbi:hypothetical protein, conserved [Eimeria necatrix]|uniref:PAZ domain-containing protein n=1 Tax=Eimeria necatrix TaxID=51315 RepID=U6MM95_9EIME|nr:hypothetical protein, conserved [Eimeria necatrix]CDJ64193.1 hypothetical protein, conserved [Eimeria necatrix]